MNIHFIGISGVSMRLLADMCICRGDKVTGSDLLTGGHRAENVDNADIVVYTCAVKENNCELVRAREKGKTIYERAEFLSIVASDYTSVIAVCGTHGKTTVTAMLGNIFANEKPQVHIGGEWHCDSSGGEFVAKQDVFITEACEYKRNFLYLHPNFLVVLNAELDHTDYYKSQSDYISAFDSFCSQSQNMVIFGDDKKLFEIAKKHNGKTFGFKKHNDYYACNVKSDPQYGTSFDVYANKKFIMKIKMQIFGRHNVLNALASIVISMLYGLDTAIIETALKNFISVDRRFEKIGAINNMTCYSDYAHHPTEIKYALKQARAVCNKKTVVAVFESHTYTRTQSLVKGFSKSLALADNILIMPIFGARENPIAGVDSNLIKNQIEQNGNWATVIDSYSDLEQYLDIISQNDGVIVFIGAGHIDSFARKIVANVGNK